MDLCKFVNKMYLVYELRNIQCSIYRNQKKKMIFALILGVKITKNCKDLKNFENLNEIEQNWKFFVDI